MKPTFSATGQPERHQRPDHPEYLRLEQRVHLAGVRVRPDQLQALALAQQNLLLLGAGERPVARVGDAGRTLQDKVVQIHCGGGGGPSRDFLNFLTGTGFRLSASSSGPVFEVLSLQEGERKKQNVGLGFEVRFWSRDLKLIFMI